jgi:serine/threonine-protein kinase
MGIGSGATLDGRYVLVDRLGRSSRGEVWKATDEVLRRFVAVKILRRELVADAPFIRRVRARARSTSGLQHEGIAATYDYGQACEDADGEASASGRAPEGEPVTYLVTELVPGEALSSMLAREGPLGLDETLDLCAQAARALHAAHRRGFSHGDVKPANLMVTPWGRVKVTDFAIPAPHGSEPLFGTGPGVTWTAHYLAPELLKGHDPSPLSDLYALGAVMYECLAGHPPFQGDNQVAVALAHLNEPLPPLPDTVPRRVRVLVGTAMEKDPRRRIPDAATLAAALENLR